MCDVEWYTLEIPDPHGRSTGVRAQLSFIFCLTGLLAASGGDLSVDPVFDRYNRTDGLSQSTLYDIHQDRYGYLWFGTMDGLIMYDAN